MNWKPILLHVAESIDALRVVPRIVLGMYGLMVWQITEWYMALPDPTTQHAALVTIVVGVIAPIIGLYQNSGRKWPCTKDDDKPSE